METKKVNLWELRLPKGTSLVKYMLVATIAIVLQSCTIGTLLTKNRVKVPDTMVGVWSTPKNKDNENLRITKKDDYWAFLDINEDGKNVRFDITMHKYHGNTFICVSHFYNGKRTGDVYKLNATSKNSLNISELTIPNEQDKKAFEAIANSNNQEDLFKKYVKQGKITAKQNKQMTYVHVE